MITGPCQAFFVVVHPRLPPGVDSYRNPTGGAQGGGCFVCIRDKPAYFPETFETEWYIRRHNELIQQRKEKERLRKAFENETERGEDKVQAALAATAKVFWRWLAS